MPSAYKLSAKEQVGVEIDGGSSLEARSFFSIDRRPALILFFSLLDSLALGEQHRRRSRTGRTQEASFGAPRGRAKLGEAHAQCQNANNL